MTISMSQICLCEVEHIKISVWSKSWRHPQLSIIKIGSSLARDDLAAGYEQVSRKHSHIEIAPGAIL